MSMLMLAILLGEQLSQICLAFHRNRIDLQPTYIDNSERLVKAKNKTQLG
jgi:hypothetical protein